MTKFLYRGFVLDLDSSKRGATMTRINTYWQDVAKRNTPEIAAKMEQTKHRGLLRRYPRVKEIRRV